MRLYLLNGWFSSINFSAADQLHLRVLPTEGSMSRFTLFCHRKSVEMIDIRAIEASGPDGEPGRVLKH